MVSTNNEGGQGDTAALKTKTLPILVANSPNLNWKPGPGEWAILACLAIVSLVVALDATILVPVLPVCSIVASYKRSISDQFS
jgi:hypothetical protein